MDNEQRPRQMILSEYLPQLNSTFLERSRPMTGDRQSLCRSAASDDGSKEMMEFGKVCSSPDGLIHNNPQTSATAPAPQL